MGGIMKKEYWKPVVGYEGLYEVSNWGRVKSLKFGKEKILKPIIRHGYYFVGLSKNGIVKSYSVHRLVAQVFIPNPNNLPCVNHKDENKQNNVVSNLEWCTHEYNNSYGTRSKRVAEKQSKPVLQYDLEGNLIKEWVSINECGRNGFNQGGICKCCNGKQKIYKGFIWKYK